MKSSRDSSAFIMVLALFCVFAASVLLTLLLGTRAYSAVSSASDRSFDRRTALSYVAEKLRHADEAGVVSLGEFGGSPALLLSEEYDGVEYETRIYIYEGTLRELFCEKGLDLEPEAGNEIISGSALSLDIRAGGLLEICFTDSQGRSERIFTALRSGGGLS